MRAVVALVLLLAAGPAVAQQQIGVVYGQQSKMVRRIMVPDLDAQLDGFCQALRPGEACAKLPKDADIAQAIGQPLYSGRAVEISPLGLVVRIIMADPLIDAAPTQGNMLLTHEQANIGDMFIGNMWVPPAPPVIPVRP